jgi:hypothetical protein
MTKEYLVDVVNMGTKATVFKQGDEYFIEFLVKYRNGEWASDDIHRCLSLEDVELWLDLRDGSLRAYNFVARLARKAVVKLIAENAKKEV